MATKTRTPAAELRALRTEVRRITSDAEAVAARLEMLGMTTADTEYEVPARMVSCAAAILDAAATKEWELDLPLRRTYSSELHLGWFEFVRAMVNGEDPTERQLAAEREVFYSGHTRMRAGRSF